MVVPPPRVKHSSGLLWVIVFLIVVLLAGAGAYYFFMLKRPSTELPEGTTPEIRTEVSQPNEGFGTGGIPVQPTPTLTQTDTTVDITKDLEGTQLTTDEADFKDINADLNSL